MPPINRINKTNASHYKWGENCDSWKLVDKENLSVKLEKCHQEPKKNCISTKKPSNSFSFERRSCFYIAEKQEIVKEKEGILIDPGTQHFIANESEKELEFLVVSQPTTAEDRTNIDSD